MLRSCRLRAYVNLIAPIINAQQTRTATVLRRVNTPPILTKGVDVSGRITQEDLDKDGVPHFFDSGTDEVKPDPWYLRYEVIEEDADAEIPPVKVILMKTMEDFGKKGQVVTLPAERVHKELLLPGLAIYASSENLEKYANIVIPEDSVQYSSETTQQKLPLVSKVVVPIVMSGDISSEQWSIEPLHIRTALRRYAGVHLEDDQCIKMPEDKSIKGPNSRNHGKEFLVRIRINDLEDIPIRCILYQTTPTLLKDEEDSNDMERGWEDLPEIPPRNWKIDFNEPIFEDQREELYMLSRQPLPEILANERRHLVAASEYQISVDDVKDLVQKYSEWKEKRDKDLFSN